MHLTLLRLRRKLTWRRFTQEKGRLIGLIIALIVILPTVVGIAFGAWFGYTHAPDQWPFQILAFVLIGLWIAWIMFPLIAASLSDGVDLERLLIYPIRRRDIVLSNMLGTLYDYPTYLVLPLYVAMIIGFGGFGGRSHAASSLAMLPLLLIVTVVGYGLMVTASQLATTAFGGILQSRKTRDVAIVLASVFGFGCWAFSQAVARIAEFGSQFLDAEQLEQLDVLHILQWFPPGALAKSVEQATLGRWGMSLIWIGYAAGWLVLLAFLWGALLDRLLTGNGFLIGGGNVEKQEKVKKERNWGWFDEMFSAETRYIFQKELVTAWRIPQRRIGLLQSYLMPIFIVVFPALSAGGDFGDIAGENSIFVIPLYAFFVFWILGQNMLGWEHLGLPFLLTTPVDRGKIFLGKAIALLLLGSIPLILITLILFVLSGSVTVLFYSIIGLFTAFTAMGVNAVFSAFFPYPVQLDFKTNRNSFTRGGCLAAFMVVIPIPIAIFITSLPLIAPPFVARFLPQYSLYAVIVGLLGIVWAVFFLHISTRYAGKELIKREPEVIRAAKPSTAD